MAVITINVDDFLTAKSDGEVVTAQEWNKLIALFQSININANALLDLMKLVDINTANIAQVTQGAVPDGSIGASKLEKSGSVKSTYRITEATTPVAGVTYYVLENNKYTPIQDLSEFDTGTVYYELITVPTEPAINDAAMFADNVILDRHLLAKTLSARVCADTLLGDLLSTNTTYYTDKGVSGNLTDSNVVDFEIKFPKAHKAVILFSGRTVSFIVANDNIPNIYIGSDVTGSSGSTQWFGTTVRVGSEKKNVAVQSILSISPNGAFNGDYPIANSPYALAGGRCVRVLQCYLSTTDTESTLHFALQRTHDQEKYGSGNWSYSFGHMIIGL